MRRKNGLATPVNLECILFLNAVNGLGPWERFLCEWLIPSGDQGTNLTGLPFAYTVSTGLR